jgi:signal transduction histidine kinase
VAEEWLCRSLEKHLAMRRRRDHMEVSLEIAGEERGKAAVKEALFRTAQEGLNNVLKHAGVCTAAVDLVFGQDSVTLYVKDRGCGFVPNQVTAAESFGLINMRARVEAVGGEFRLRSTFGEGTEIEARVPLRRGGQA